MNYQEKYDKRLAMLNGFADHEKLDYVPVASMAQTWAMDYAGETAETTFTSVEKEFEVYGKHLKELDFDATALFGMNRPLQLYNSLGYSAFFFSKDHITLQHQDNRIINDDEIEEYIQNPLKFIRNKGLYRRYPVLRQDFPTDIAALGEGLKMMMAFGEKNAQIPEYLRNHVGAPCFGGDLMEPALDRYICYRSFQNGMADLRRRPQLVLDALEATYPLVAPTPLPKQPFPWAFFPVVTATYLSRKMFDKFFWPTAKRSIEGILNTGGKVIVALEGKWAHVYDHFLEFPKGSIICALEDDDFIQAKKAIGDTVALAGGMPVQLMREGTKQQNIDYVKNIIDECGSEGIMFMPSQGLLSPGDVNVDNLRATIDFIHEYTS